MSHLSGMTRATVDENICACFTLLRIFLNLLRAMGIVDSSNQDQRPRWKYCNISQLVILVGNNSDCTVAYGLEQWRYLSV